MTNENPNSTDDAYAIMQEAQTEGGVSPQEGLAEKITDAEQTLQGNVSELSSHMEHLDEVFTHEEGSGENDSRWEKARAAFEKAKERINMTMITVLSGSSITLLGSMVVGNEAAVKLEQMQTLSDNIESLNNIVEVTHGIADIAMVVGILAAIGGGLAHLYNEHRYNRNFRVN